MRSPRSLGKTRRGSPARVARAGGSELTGVCPLSAKERADRGPFFRSTLDRDAVDGVVVVDTDTLDRLVTVEVLYRPDVEVELRAAVELLRRAR